MNNFPCTFVTRPTPQLIPRPMAKNNKALPATATVDLTDAPAAMWFCEANSLTSALRGSSDACRFERCLARHADSESGGRLCAYFGGHGKQYFNARRQRCGHEYFSLGKAVRHNASLNGKQ